MSYTPPAHGACDFNFTLSYSAPAHGSVNFAFTSEIIYTYVPSGGVVFAGTGLWNRTRSPIASGGLTFAGSAPTHPTIVRVYVPSGGFTFAGLGLYNPAYTFTYVTSGGGLIFSGAALIAIVKKAIVSGGIQLGGSGHTFKTYIYPYRYVDYFSIGHENHQRRGWST
jgi:hypothetical protein